jgi:membrane fusion protein (multidrug efflux system)
MTDTTATPNPPRRQRRFLRFMVRLVLMIVVPGVAALVGAFFYVNGQRYVTSENAYVKADKITITSEVSGKVLAVEVREHDTVEQGQLLFRIDDEPYRIALEDASAQRERIRAEVESLRARYRVKRAELKLAREDLAYFERTFKRRQKLLKKGNVSEERFDQARRNENSARQKIAILKSEMTQILTGLNGKSNLKAEEYPKFLQAQATYDRRLLDLQRTLVYAPASGRVSKIELEPGEFVKSEEPLFAVISDQDVWVEANLKETQLTHVNVGQNVVVEIDAYPDIKWRAIVESISPATGAEFAILPPQNATGNWIKVVQRLPLRLVFEDPKSGPILRAGMSVEIEIDTEHEAVLPGFVKEALAWVNGGK